MSGMYAVEYTSLIVQSVTKLKKFEDKHMYPGSSSLAGYWVLGKSKTLI